MDVENLDNFTHIKLYHAISLLKILLLISHMPDGSESIPRCNLNISSVGCWAVLNELMENYSWIAFKWNWSFVCFHCEIVPKRRFVLSIDMESFRDRKFVDVLLCCVKWEFNTTKVQFRFAQWSVIKSSMIKQNWLTSLYVTRHQFFRKILRNLLRNKQKIS